jgi:hypothetical protein
MEAVVSERQFTGQDRSEYLRIDEPGPVQATKSGDSPSPGKGEPTERRPTRARFQSMWRRLATRLRVDEHDDLKPPLPVQAIPLEPYSQAQNVGTVEKRVVEQILQSLASVEGKLERSHVDLMARSDEIERRLIILWDLEEGQERIQQQQDSLLKAMERQHLIQSAILSQHRRTLRYAAAAVSFALGAAAGSLLLLSG